MENKDPSPPGFPPQDAVASVTTSNIDPGPALSHTAHTNYTEASIFDVPKKAVNLPSSTVPETTETLPIAQEPSLDCFEEAATSSLPPDEQVEENSHEIIYQPAPTGPLGDVEQCIRYASTFSTATLYKAYRRHLKHDSDPSDDPNRNQANNAPRLVKDIVDYVGVLEDRIADLESKVHGDLDGKRAEKLAQPAPFEDSEQVTPEQIIPEPTVALEWKFYSAENEMDANGYLSHPTVNSKGSFTSPSSNTSDVVTDEVEQTGEKNNDSTQVPGTHILFNDQDRKNEDYDCAESLEHFRILLEFLHTYLSRQLELFGRLRAGQENKVSFENLWMLFDGGDIIYSPLNEGGIDLEEEYYGKERHPTRRRNVPQAYRVINTNGGLPLRATLAPQTVKKRADMVRRTGIIGTAYGAKKAELQERIDAKMISKYTPLYVYCFCLAFDGKKYATVLTVFKYIPYESEADIQTLNAYPLQYLDRQLKTTISRERREGLQYLTHRINTAVIVDVKLAFQQYKDKFQDLDTLVSSSSSLQGHWERNKDPFQVYDTFGGDCPQKHPLCIGYDCHWDESDYRQEQARSKFLPDPKLLHDEYENVRWNQKDGLEQFVKFMEDNELIQLLPCIVPGFALRNRKWGKSTLLIIIAITNSLTVQLNLDHLQHVQQEKSWKDLVLPEGYKKMVRGLVESHGKGIVATDTPASNKLEMDLVRGKGKGCVILLHGEPGVGKTSTAECVAAYTKKPLYPITCGDIGYTPTEVERNLEEHFELAHKWGCVLLLDEADVFLAKRSREDIKRNGLVSVFLRVLEYYSGILFLTTNRVGALDDAFRSRLHLTLYYPKLDRVHTIKIWNANLKRLATVNERREEIGLPQIKFNEKRILKWAERNFDALGWNGRQIRNAFQTAVALAEYKATTDAARAKSSKTIESPEVEVDDFKTIARASKIFNTYLIDLHGQDEDYLAKREVNRARNDFIDRHKDKLDFKFDDSDDSDESSGIKSGTSPDRKSGENSSGSLDGDGSSESDRNFEKEKKKTKGSSSKKNRKKESDSKSHSKSKKKDKQ
ncbi:MAG: hypothetical protein M1820_009023 [Bogoriella megaspora]|nr:MAG: hypothetical protein M1820_009023 [Bogoriella megaspora]